MNIKNYITKFLMAFIIVTGLISCEQELEDLTPPSVSEFSTPTTTSSYYIRNIASSVFKIPVGITTVSDKDRVVELTITSPTGAVNGTHYTAPTTITIPAGQADDTLIINGIFNSYNGGRIDTLLIKITGGDVPPNAYGTTYTLILRQYCDPVLDGFLGTYNNTREVWGTSAYGPYTTAISSYTSISPTKARIVVENLYDYGWGPITFELDWANPSNLTATVVPQTSGIGDAGTLSSTYAGAEIQVRAFAGQTGTFDSCEPNFTLKMQLGVVGLGYFGSLYTVTLKR